MKQLNCFIIDDEPVARKIIREYIAETDFLSLAGEAETPVALAEGIGSGTELLFLDVQMPGINGIDFLRSMGQGSALTILTTAYPGYALQGFELDVLDYLVKPVSQERFQKAAQKALDYYMLKERAGKSVSAEEMLFIKCDRMIERIYVRDIRYVEAMANYMIVHTAKRRYITYQTFTGMSERLPAARFVRIHKSYLVALSALTGIAGNKALLEKTELPISRYYRSSAMKKINTQPQVS
jgi:DNA-binding LytR/AlgR family response regulator